MSGFDNDVVYAKNADFSAADNQSVSENNGLISNGQIWIGSTSLNAGGTHVNVGSFTSPDGSILVGYASPNITLRAAATGTVTNVLTANATPQFTGTTTKTVDFNLSNLVLGSSLPALTSGNGLVGMGQNVFSADTSGGSSVAFGSGCLSANTTGTGNSAVGFNAMLNNITGNSNSAFGNASLRTMQSGSGNSAFGESSCQNLNGGNNNAGFGYLALSACVTGSSNSACGQAALGNNNGNQNCAIGSNAMVSAGTGSQNVVGGFNSGVSISDGSFNSIWGNQAFQHITTGSYNIGIGQLTGESCATGTESSNLYINNAGVNAESNAIRIGTAGSGSSQQNVCYIAGISGVTVTGAAVLCATDGQLGTIVSSLRYKENVQPMPDNLPTLSLQPVSFNFKSDEDKKIQYGLIAEEVDKVFPYLCIYGDDGLPHTVKYHELCVFLLMEIQKLNSRVATLES